MNLVEKLDSKKYETELLCIDSVPGIYDKRLKQRNVSIQTLLPKTIANPIIRYLKAYRSFRTFIQKQSGKYDVVHFNIAQGEELPFIHMAKREGVPVRILHSHNSSVNSRLKYLGHIVCKMLYKNDANCYIACSDLAAKWILPKRVYLEKKYKIIKNGIDVQKYTFSHQDRTEKREEMKIGDRPLFLNIGRLNHQKNQSFLLDVFSELHRQIPNALLLVAGEGELRPELEKKTIALGLENCVQWLGNRTDISKLLSAADVFLLPSLFEGLPYTIIEAQASGINSVISDTISEESIITDKVIRAPLIASAFANAAIAALNSANIDRALAAKMVKNAGYDIHHTATMMDSIYEGRDLIK